MRLQVKSICALVSGGLDSCVMVTDLLHCYRHVQPLYIREGLAWEQCEIRHLRRFLRSLPLSLRQRLLPLRVLDLPVNDLFAGHWSLTGRHVPDADTPDDAMYLPGRNLLLLAKSAVFCAQQKIPLIAVGSLYHNPFADASAEFLRDFGRVAGTGLGSRLRIVAPFRRLTKAQVVRRGAKLGVPLDLSFSCVAPKQGRHCGRCNKCAERQRAFAAANVADKTRYGA